MVFAALTLAGAALNFAPFTLHFRVDFIFGSIFALIAIYMLPTTAGILSAVLIAVPTYILWNHPLGIVMYTLEAVFIIILMKKTRLHLLSCAAITWFVILPPIILANMHLSGLFFPSAIRLFVLKYVINGIFNASVATALIFLFKLKAFGQKDSEIRASEAAMNVFIIVTVIPLLIFTLLDSRILSDSVFSKVQSRHDSLKKTISLMVKHWHDHHTAELQQIAVKAQMLPSDDISTLRSSIKTLCNADPAYQYICFADSHGKSLACFPDENADGQTNVGRDFSTQPYIKSLIDTGKPAISGIIVDNMLASRPIIIIAEPVIKNGELTGYVAGALDLTSLNKLIQTFADEKVQILLLDETGSIVYDQTNNHAGQKHDKHIKQAISIMGGKLMIVLAANDLVASNRFRNSTVILNSRLLNPLNWELVIEEPMTEYVENLFELSFKQFFNIAVLTLLLILLSGLIRRYFSIPLRELSDFTNAIAQTGFCKSTYQAPTSNIMEIRQLVENFSAAVERIVETQNLEREKNLQLQTANEKLHEKVVQLKQTQLAVEQAEKSFSTLVNNSPFAILLADSNGNIEFVNEEFTRNTNLSIRNISNLKDVFSKFEPFGRIGFPISDFLSDLTSKYGINKRIDTGDLRLQKDNELRIFNCIASVIESRCIVIFSDITGAAIAVEEKNRMAEQLQVAQKFESLGTLAGGVAHDLNNILMSIMGYAELSLAELPKSGKLQEKIRLIQTAAQRAAELTRQVLDFTGKNKFCIAPFDLSELVKEMTTLLSVTISKKVTVKFDLAENLTALGDLSQIRQIAMNLVMNASEAIGQTDGQITIRTGQSNKQDDFLKSAVVSNLNPECDYYAFFEVADTGCGIEPEMLKKIFDPFFTTKFTGRGLGLAATIGIVRLHHGAIHVSSTPEVGSCFRIIVPASEKGGTITSIKEDLPQQLNLKGKILLADDEDTILSLTEMMLEPYSANLICASDGAMAVELFEEHHQDLALVILDMVMPKLNGEEALIKMRAINPTVPIVISSGNSYDETIQRLADNSVDGFLQKPFRMNELIRQICAITARQKPDSSAS
ncbi:MAG: response regulator [Candidatus Riflebacteria bacterium]|nr:response regulator [Candidatus Riflebacteria bacterium]